jgi:DNA polymerase-3 subunit gamma/tau
MAYQSLYRRYRPRRFSDVKDQEHVVRALRNAVREDRVGHAYLFSGPRGTGKTSTARILAKALNCEHLIDGEPDGTCESCLAIDAGTSYDVQELDAASNNKVEDVRDLIGRVALGSPGRTKVYILDEVHMLTPAASASLLKTLEEPPDHVVFVLATTDPQKVLPTIRSRTQHFEFHLLSAEQLAEHVQWVIHDAGLDLPDDVVEHVVRQGGGSARDTLSALDQVAAAGGVLDRADSLDDLLDAIAAADPGRALVALADAVAAGRDPRVLGEAVLARLRDVFLARMHADLSHLPAAEVDRVRAWGDQLGDRATTRALEAVGEALLEMRQAPDTRIPLEVALVKLTRREGDASVDGLLDRIGRLEAQVAALSAGGPVAVPAPTPSSGDTTPAPAAAPAPAPAPAPAIPPRPTSAAAGSGGPAPSPSPAAPSGGAAPPGPARPGGGSGGGAPRPADLARQALAEQRGERAARTGARPAAAPAASAAPPPPSPRSPATAAPGGGAPGPATPSSPAAPAAAAAGAADSDDASAGGAAPGPSGPDAPAAGSATTSAPAAAPAISAPTPEAASPAPATSAPAVAGGGALAQLDGLWNGEILGSLGGLAKAMYSAGRFTSLEGGVATFALPNEVHRQKCEQKRTEVEQAVSARLGSPVTLRLVVDDSVEGGAAPGSGSGSGSGGGRGGSGGGRGADAAPEDPDEHLAGADVHDLDDAPDAPLGGIAALTEAFPGSELIDES